MLIGYGINESNSKISIQKCGMNALTQISVTDFLRFLFGHIRRGLQYYTLHQVPCSIPGKESSAVQCGWSSRNSIGVRMDSTDLAVDGGELQVLSGSGTLAESGRQVGSGSRWGFAETLEGMLVVDLNDDCQDVQTRGHAYVLEEYSM
jgi:hypothetical protein